jgi:hypothetical protein
MYILKNLGNLELIVISSCLMNSNEVSAVEILTSLKLVGFTTLKYLPLTIASSFSDFETAVESKNFRFGKENIT